MREAFALQNTGIFQIFTFERFDQPGPGKLLSTLLHRLKFSETVSLEQLLSWNINFCLSEFHTLTHAYMLTYDI